MRSSLLSLLLLLVPSGGSAASASAFDWSLDWALPHHDVSVGVTGGINFGEEGRGFNRGPTLGLSLGYHHELLGIQAELGGRHEGLSSQLGGSLEVVFWYIALLGGGVTYWEALSEPGRDIPQRAWGISGFVGIPVPIARFESGTLTLVPYARPGLRFVDHDNVQGHHEAGIRLSWTTFRF